MNQRGGRDKPRGGGKINQEGRERPTKRGGRNNLRGDGKMN